MLYSHSQPASFTLGPRKESSEVGTTISRKQKLLQSMYVDTLTHSSSTGQLYAAILFPDVRL